MNSCHFQIGPYVLFLLPLDIYDLFLTTKTSQPRPPISLNDNDTLSASFETFVLQNISETHPGSLLLFDNSSKEPPHYLIGALSPTNPGLSDLSDSHASDGPNGIEHSFAITTIGVFAHVPGDDSRSTISHFLFFLYSSIVRQGIHQDLKSPNSQDLEEQLLALTLSCLFLMLRFSRQTGLGQKQSMAAFLECGSPLGVLLVPVFDSLFGSYHIGHEASWSLIDLIDRYGLSDGPSARRRTTTGLRQSSLVLGSIVFRIVPFLQWRTRTNSNRSRTRSAH
mmetsp:Transcript_5388/g.11521  ORF Transcript_5388/g.11521 Transcript_5388/m.11521 type:complete len:280 (+) Transcript_5388:722-1561(+)